MEPEISGWVGGCTPRGYVVVPAVLEGKALYLLVSRDGGHGRTI